MINIHSPVDHKLPTIPIPSLLVLTLQTIKNQTSSISNDITKAIDNFDTDNLISAPIRQNYVDSYDSYMQEYNELMSDLSHELFMLIHKDCCKYYDYVPD